MIKLNTDCSNCLHAKVCKHKDNAKHAMDMLKVTPFGIDPGATETWETVMNKFGVNIIFSCPDYIINKNIRTNVISI